MEKWKNGKMEILKMMSFFDLKFKWNPRKNKVVYKIINEGKRRAYILQCVNSKTVFEASILEIIFDTDILHGLHPLQSCFIGIEYAFYIRSLDEAKERNEKEIDMLNTRKIISFSKLKLKYINRRGFICYVNTLTNEEKISDPKEIVFIDSIIKEFHPSESFYIGLCAGKKMSVKTNVVFFCKDQSLIKINEAYN